MKYSEISMKVTAYIERGLDGTYDINMEYLDDIPFGVLGQGNTLEEAKADFYNSYREMLEWCEEEGITCPPLEFEFKYDLVEFLQKQTFGFTLSGLERITGVNQRQLSHYLNGVRKPSKATIEKITAGIRALGKEMAEIQLT